MGMGDGGAKVGFAKGTSIAVTLDLVRERGGERAIADLASRLPPEVREALGDDLRPIATARYPFEAWIEVLIAAEAIFGAGFVRESSRLGYEKLLATTYRSTVVPGDAAATLRRMPRLWEQLTVGIGRVEVADRDGETVVIVELEIPDRFKRTATERVAGLVEALVAAAGSPAAALVTPGAQGVEIRVVFTTP